MFLAIFVTDRSASILSSFSNVFCSIKLLWYYMGVIEFFK